MARMYRSARGRHGNLHRKIRADSIVRMQRRRVHKELVETVDFHRAILVSATTQQMRAIVGEWWTVKEHRKHVKEVDDVMTRAVAVEAGG